jgi:acetylornithine deacetylase
VSADAALAALDPDELTADLAGLIRIPSVTGDERAVLEHLRDRALALGLEARLDVHDLEDLRRRDGYPGEEASRTELLGLRVGLPGRRESRRGQHPRLALCAHVDVVGPGTAPWRYGPWSAILEEGVDEVHGRGAADMKAGVAACLHALAAVHRSGAQVACDPVFLAVSSEEDGGLGAFAALEDDADWDACVIPEPTGFDVICAQAGAITFQGVVHGVAAHAAFRRQGVSAIDRYVPVHAALARFEEDVNAQVDDALMAALDLPYPVLVGRVEAGEWSSTVPDRLVFEGRAPVRVGQSVTDARAAVERAIAAAVTDGGPAVEVTWPGASFASARTPPLDAWPEVVLGAARAERGQAVPAGVPWGADMRLFAARGIPTVMVGPTPIAMHGVDERVSLQDVIATARILTRAVCAGPPRRT